MELRYESESPEQTYAYGKELGEILQDGDIVALYGELGAGKNCFCKGYSRRTFSCGRDNKPYVHAAKGLLRKA